LGLNYAEIYIFLLVASLSLDVNFGVYLFFFVGIWVLISYGRVVGVLMGFLLKAFLWKLFYYYYYYFYFVFVIW
jgi:hypothetical protein